MGRVMSETCSCGARLELDDWMVGGERTRVLDGFRAQHAGCLQEPCPGPPPGQKWVLRCPCGNEDCEFDQQGTP